MRTKGLGKREVELFSSKQGLGKDSSRIHLEYISSRGHPKTQALFVGCNNPKTKSEKDGFFE